MIQLSLTGTVAVPPAANALARVSRSLPSRSDYEATGGTPAVPVSSRLELFGRCLVLSLTILSGSYSHGRKLVDCDSPLNTVSSLAAKHRSAVDVKDLSGDVLGPVRSEKYNRQGDVIRGGDALQRNGPGQFVFELFIAEDSFV